MGARVSTPPPHDMGYHYGQYPLHGSYMHSKGVGVPHVVSLGGHPYHAPVIHHYQATPSMSWSSTHPSYIHQYGNAYGHGPFEVRTTPMFFHLI